MSNKGYIKPNLKGKITPEMQTALWQGEYALAQHQLRTERMTQTERSLVTQAMLEAMQRIPPEQRPQ